VNAAPTLGTHVDSSVRAFIESVGSFAAGIGLSDAQDQMHALVEANPEQPALVVFAGEAKRGKSSLLNALLGREGLLPVDHNVATNTSIVLRHGRQEGILVSIDGRDKPASYGLDQLDTWASVRGEQERLGAEQGAQLVTGIVVTLAEPILGRLTCVDTPGVGGLAAAHADVTLGALAGAEALVFVLDASAPASEPELRFLARAVELVPEAIVVLAKADGPHASWSAILEEDRRLLAQHVPNGERLTLLHVSAISALEALAARRRGDMETADALERAGHVGELARELTERVAPRARRIRLSRLLRAAEGMLDRCAGSLDAQMRTVASDADSRREVQRRLEVVDASLQPDAGWRQTVEEEVSRMLSILGEQAQAHRDGGIHRIAGDHGDVRDASQLQALVRDLDRELTAMQQVLAGTYMKQLASALRRLERTLREVELEDLISDLAPPSEPRAEVSPPRQMTGLGAGEDMGAAAAAARSGLTAVQLLSGSSSSYSESRSQTGATGTVVAVGQVLQALGIGGASAGALALVNPATAAVAVLIGVSVIGLKRHRDKRASQIEQAHQALEGALAGADEIRDGFLKAAEDLRGELGDRVERRLEDRRALLDANRQQNAEQRATELARLEGSMAELERLRAHRTDLRALVWGEDPG
jgi:hypothetical protein